jgi:hypothetical protein
MEFYGSVLWLINMLTWHCIDEEGDDKKFMGAMRILWGETFPKYADTVLLHYL